MKISGMEILPAPPEEDARGLLGFVSFLIDGWLRVDGVAVRRKLDGELTLSWPARTDREGKRHPYMRPIDDASRRAVEDAVFAEILRIEPEVAP